MRIVPILVGVLALTTLACSGPGGGDAAKNEAVKPIEVETASVVSAPMPQEIELVGSLVAERQVQVAADTNGLIVDTRVERGQQVRRGEVLVVVDPRASRLSSVASAAQSEAQRAQLAVADQDCVRAESLFAAGVIARAQYERTIAACKAQREAAAAALAQSQLASTNADRTTVRAPFDGVIGERMVEVGSFVGSQSPVATLYAEGGLRAKMTVPETQIAGLSVGRPVTLRSSALPGQSFGATVQFVSGAVREATRDLVVEAVLSGPAPELRPGMFVQATVNVGDREVLAVPEAALRTEGTVSRLFKVVEGRAIEVVVRVGSGRDGLRAVLSDLALGDQVVVNPPADLRDGGMVQ